jgi:hypothetical protein
MPLEFRTMQPRAFSRPRPGGSGWYVSWRDRGRSRRLACGRGEVGRGQAKAEVARIRGLDDLPRPDVTVEGA